MVAERLLAGEIKAAKAWLLQLRTVPQTCPPEARELWRKSKLEWPCGEAYVCGLTCMQNLGAADNENLSGSLWDLQGDI
jgi:hypothetical protein